MILRGAAVLVALTVAACWIEYASARLLSERGNAEEDREECAAVNYKHPHTCTPEVNCDFIVTWQRDAGSTWINFTLVASMAEDGGESGWAAVGFSSDEKMQDTDVVACWLTDNDTAQIHTGWNRPDAHKFIMDSEHNGVSLFSASMEDGKLFCSFSRCVVPSDETDKPLNESWYVLTASGSFDEAGAMRQHDKMSASGCKCNVTDCTDDCFCLHSFRYFLLKLHGVVMTVIFLFLIPSGAFISRYFKLVFVATWINAHIVLMVSGAVGSVFGLFLILGHTHFVFSVGVHQLVGIVCISLVVLQPLYGFLRPENGPSLKRKVFNVVHRILAVCILILGVVALFWGCYLFRSSAMAWMLAALGLSLVTNVCFVLVLELLTRTHKFYTVPPVGYHKVTKHDELSESEEEVFVRDTPSKRTGTRGTKGKGTSYSPEFRMEKTVLLLFILQSFGFTMLIGGLIFYYDSTVHL